MVDIKFNGPVIHKEVCDTSGAAALDPANPADARFLVADDEDEDAVIRLYNATVSGPKDKHGQTC